MSVQEDINQRVNFCILITGDLKSSFVRGDIERAEAELEAIKRQIDALRILKGKPEMSEQDNETAKTEAAVAKDFDAYFEGGRHFRKLLLEDLEVKRYACADNLAPGLDLALKMIRER